MIGMEGRGIRFIVYAITICVLYGVLNYLSNRNNTVNRSGQDDTHYIVRVPGALKYIYFVMFLLGIVMFIMFFFFKMKGNPTVTAGHIRLSLIVAAIGLFVMILANRWQVTINGDQMEIRRLFGRDERLPISGIEKAEIGEKEQIILYQNGKKVVTVDGLSDNYDRFRKTLKQYGKLK